MLAHDAPLAPYEVPEVTRIRSQTGIWPERALAYARVGAERMHAAFLGVRPRLFVHGRYHVADEAAIELPDATYSTRIWSLNCDGVEDNLRYLDLAALDAPSGRPAAGR